MKIPYSKINKQLKRELGAGVQVRPGMSEGKISPCAVFFEEDTPEQGKIAKAKAIVREHVPNVLWVN